MERESARIDAGRRPRRFRGQSGQAITELLLLALPLMMIAAALLQVFLVDEYTFRLATKAHRRMLTEVAFPRNRATTSYDTPRVRWNDPEQFVPLVGFFRPYGLTRADLRIRSTARGGEKQIMIGRGTAATLTPDGADMSVLVDDFNAGEARRMLDQANAMRLDLEAQRRGGH